MITKTIDLYGDGRDVSLTTYLLEDAPEEGGSRPAILICPGGAYLGCSDHEAEPVALRFADMGYHAFVLRYSTYFGRFSEAIDLQGMIPKANTIHPAPVRDIAKAFLLIREHAEAWAVDVEQICICGFSAGAHNCMMYGAYWDTPQITDYYEEESSMFKPAAAILSYGLADPRMINHTYDDPLGEQLYNAMMIALLGTAEPDDDLLDEVSPTLHISESFPPSFLWATAEDELVPAENSIEMASVLAEAGIPYELHIFESGRHGLGLSDESLAGTGIPPDPDAAKWVELAEVWLTKRFSIE